LLLSLLWACGSGGFANHPEQGPSKLAFTGEPTSTMVGAMMSPVSVTVLDGVGNPVVSATTSITVALGSNAAKGKLSGTTTLAAVRGVAIFSDLSLDTSGTGYILSVGAPGLTGATSTPFDVSPAPAVATKLGFVVQPSTSLVNHAITPAVQVALEDDQGNAVTNASTNVTVAIETGPTGAILSGTLNAMAVNGIATFSDLSIDTTSTGYTLSAAADGLTGATSQQFAITAIPLVFANVSAGDRHTCGVTTTAEAFCWGSDFYGQLGNGPGEILPGADSTSPVAVVNYTGLPPLTFATASASFGHTCGITTDGGAYGWGYGPNGAGYSGPTPHPQGPAYAPSKPPLTFATLSAGGFDANSGIRTHTCGVTTAGAAYCYGANSLGQLGNGSTTDAMYATAVAGGLTFATVSAGGGSSGSAAYTCGLTTAGAAYCWGDNSSGQLGDATTTGRTSPVAIGGGLTFAAVSAGGDHTCGVTGMGAGYCWGGNSSGQLGDGTTTGETSPVKVSRGLSFTALSGGDSHTCGITTGGGVFCWGDNSSGQLGDGTTTTRMTPVAVLGELTFAALSAGAAHTCGVTTAGAAYCWGDNSFGQLGDGTTTASSVPVKVADQQ